MVVEGNLGKINEFLYLPNIKVVANICTFMKIVVSFRVSIK